MKDAFLRRDVGIANSQFSAESNMAGWTDIAVDAVRNYAESHHEFLTEDIRADLSSDFPRPPDDRAWGAVMRRCVREQIIVRCGYAAAKSSNLSPKPLWRSNIFSDSPKLGG